MFSINKSEQNINIFNLGTDEYCQVIDSIKWISDELNVKPKLKFTGGERGWIGDNPFIYLDTTKIRKLGWKPRLNIQDSVTKTVSFLSKNEWIFETRK